MKQLRPLTDLLSYINNHPLARRHKTAAYLRLLHWQITQFIHPAEKKIRFVHETFLSVSKGMTGATGNIYLGLHDFCEMGFLLHFLTEEDIFADIGANIGSYSILASGVNRSNTIAFEPSLKTFRQLQKNISINRLDNKIKAYNIALGSKEDKVFFTTALDTVNHVVPSKDAQKATGVEVSVDTLDNFLAEHGIPALIKIDVEGFETEVIIGMEKTLRHENLKAIIIELNGAGCRYGYDERMIDKKLRLQGFEPHLYDPFDRTFELSADFGSYNTLYVRDLSFVKNRVLGAQKIEVFNEKF